MRQFLGNFKHCEIPVLLNMRKHRCYIHIYIQYVLLIQWMNTTNRWYKSGKSPVKRQILRIYKYYGFIFTSVILVVLDSSTGTHL